MPYGPEEILSGGGMGLGLPAWLGPAAVGASVVGGGIEGAMAAEESAKQRRQQGKFARAQIAPGLARSIETAPLRDRLLHTLLARAGMPPQRFVGGDPFSYRPGVGVPEPQQGGLDFERFGEQMAGYTPGAGGVDPSIYRFLLESLGIGYAPGQGYMRSDDPRTFAGRTDVGGIHAPGSQYQGPGARSPWRPRFPRG